MCNALTVTKRESAPLPERLYERITYSIAMFAIWVNSSDKFVQCEGADHRRHSTPKMQNILLQNVVGHAVRKAKNFAGGVTDTIFSGRPALINYSCSLALRRWRRLISPFAAVTKKPAVLSPGSLSCSISPITSCGILTVVICDFTFFAPVAISGSPKNWCMSIYAKKTIEKDLKCIPPVSKLKSKSEIHLKEQRPAVLATHAERLTINDSRSAEIATRNHTTHPQGRDSHNLNKYIWRFIILSTAQPRAVHIEATSEQETHQQSPDGCVMVFAARIRQEVEHVQCNMA